MKEILAPPRLGSVSCGVSPSKRGRLLYVADVATALEYILDNDELVRDRAQQFLENLLK